MRQDEGVITEAATEAEGSSHVEDAKAPLAGEKSSAGRSLAFTASNETNSTGTNKDDAISQVKEYQVVNITNCCF